MGFEVRFVSESATMKPRGSVSQTLWHSYGRTKMRYDIHCLSMTWRLTSRLSITILLLQSEHVIWISASSKFKIGDLMEMLYKPLKLRKLWRLGTYATHIGRIHNNILRHANLSLSLFHYGTHSCILNPSVDLTKPLGWVLHARHCRRIMGHFDHDV